MAKLDSIWCSCCSISYTWNDTSTAYRYTSCTIPTLHTYLYLPILHARRHISLGYEFSFHPLWITARALTGICDCAPPPPPQLCCTFLPRAFSSTVYGLHEWSPPKHNAGDLSTELQGGLWWATPFTCTRVIDLNVFCTLLLTIPCLYRVPWLYRNTSGSLGECEMLWEHKLAGKCVRRFFWILPNFHQSYYNSIKTWKTCFLFLLEKTTTKYRNPVYSDRENLNFLCSHYLCVSSSC